MSDVEGYHLGADEGTSWWFLDTLMTIKAGAPQTHGGFTLIDCRAPAGFGPPLHVHRDEDEGFYVLDGQLAVRCGEQSWTATEGSFVLLPRGVPHAFAVTGGRDCRLLQITSPAKFEGFVAEAGRPAQSLRLPEPSMPDVAALAEVASKYGNQLVGPPLVVGR
jgi:mannose-6-phosphate isomerase-like protein (cupin superfamily)